MNHILRAALDHGDTSLIAAGVLAHPRSHQLLKPSIDKIFKFALKEAAPTSADAEMVCAIGRSFLVFDGELA
ncbi:hypothetical protein [Hyphomicrobium sp. CS1GBMeth3]|uniref:hypothetical protein n=1 Tax=Hyphomicrobium sp. CS1GBMeth3 TaxID=1892845 RepID=UPI000930FC42|nr:hypothetical protein [Hyphomicrobium sp. CS1GBMeth3]